jgi:hypothetical protein
MVSRSGTLTGKLLLRGGLAMISVIPRWPSKPLSFSLS